MKEIKRIVAFMVMIIFIMNMGFAATSIPPQYRYYQSESRWNTGANSVHNIAPNGCGPTAVAIVMSSLTNKDFTPIDFAKMPGYSGNRTESTPGLINLAINIVGERYGFNSPEYNRVNSWETISVSSAQALRNILTTRNDAIIGHITNHFFAIDCASYDPSTDSVGVSGYKGAYHTRTVSALIRAEGFSGRRMDEVYVFGNGINTNTNTNTNTSNDTNICEDCGGIIGTTYYPLGDKHYRTCANNHHSYILDHEYVDGKCKFCGAIKSNKPESGSVQTNICQDCGGIIGGTYYSLGDKHYRTCANNHHSYIGSHNFVNGICIICREVQYGEVCTVPKCGGVIGKEYYPFGENHYRACVNNKEHPYYIELHNYVNGKCTVCDTIQYGEVCPDCGELLGEKYYPLGENHYRQCVNGHPYYVEAHNYINGECNLCKATKGSNVVKEAIFSDLPVDHWAYNDVKAMVDAGIVNGRGDGTFGTNDPITAEEYLALLSRIAVTKKGDIAYSNNGYLVDRIEGWSNSDYRKLMPHIETPILDRQIGEAEIKLILGNSDEEVLANYKKPITREKAANITSRLIESTNDTSVNVLNANDWNNVNSIYRKGINKLAEKGIFKGVDNGDGTINVNPKHEISRVEAISLVSRLYNYL